MLTNEWKWVQFWSDKEITGVKVRETSNIQFIIYLFKNKPKGDNNMHTSEITFAEKEFCCYIFKEIYAKQNVKLHSWNLKTPFHMLEMLYSIQAKISQRNRTPNFFFFLPLSWKFSKNFPKIKMFFLSFIVSDIKMFRR